MTLTDYIDTLGVPRLCKLYGIGRSTAYDWQNLNSVPKPKKAYLIIKKSGGVVSWKNIYEPYVKAILKKERKRK